MTISFPITPNDVDTLYLLFPERRAIKLLVELKNENLLDKFSNYVLYLDSLQPYVMQIIRVNNGTIVVDDHIHLDLLNYCDRYYNAFKAKIQEWKYPDAFVPTLQPVFVYPDTLTTENAVFVWRVINQFLNNNNYNTDCKKRVEGIIGIKGITLKVIRSADDDSMLADIEIPYGSTLTWHGEREDPDMKTPEANLADLLIRCHNYPDSLDLVITSKRNLVLNIWTDGYAHNYKISIFDTTLL